MIRALRRRGTAALGLGLAAVLTAATGCGGDDDAVAAGESGKITLTVNVFGNFGYEDLYKQYQASHPNVTIVERGTGSDLSNYTPALTKNLAAGSGAGDVVALEEGIMIQFKEQAQNFADLGEYGGNDDQGNFLPWKFEGGQASDGKQLIGLGTDVGSMGMCYRRDLFAKAGLPTDRDAVAKLWPTWQDYVTVGNQFKGKNTGAKWFDAASNTYNTILVQEAGKSPGYTYYDRDNQLVVESNPAIKQAYDQMLAMIGDGLSAGYKSFSDQWNAGFKQGTFATIACPAWMLGYIKGQAGDANKGKWDVTTAPGERRQLGRLVARGAQAEQAPEGGGRAGPLPDQPEGPGRRLQGGQRAAVVAGGPGRPGDQGVQERRTSTTPRSARSSAPVPRSSSRSTSDRATRRSGTRWRTRCWRCSRASSSRRRPGRRRSRTPSRRPGEVGGAGGERTVAVGTTVHTRTRVGPVSGRPGRSGPQLDQEEPMSAEAGTPVRPAGRPAGPARRARLRPGGRPDRPRPPTEPRRERWRMRLSRADIRALAVPLHRAVLRALRRSSASTRWSTRPGCRCTTGSWPATSTRATGLDNYAPAGDRPGLLELAVATRSGSSCSPRCRS